MKKAVDGRGLVFKVGDKVARAITLGVMGTATCKVCTVTAFDDKGLPCLDGSRVSMKVTERLLILNRKK